MNNSQQFLFATLDDGSRPLHIDNNADADAETDVSNFEVQYLPPQSQEAPSFPPSIRFVARPQYANVTNLIAESIIYLQITTNRCPHPNYSDITNGFFRRVSLIIRDDAIRESRVWEAVSGIAQENNSNLYHYYTLNETRIPNTFEFDMIFDRNGNKININVYVERSRLNPTHVISVRFTFNCITNNGQGLQDGDIVQYINERLLTSIYGNSIQRVVLPQAEGMIFWRYFNAALATNTESDVN